MLWLRTRNPGALFTDTDISAAASGAEQRAGALRRIIVRLPPASNRLLESAFQSDSIKLYSHLKPLEARA